MRRFSKIVWDAWFNKVESKDIDFFWSIVNTSNVLTDKFDTDMFNSDITQKSFGQTSAVISPSSAD